MTLSAPPIRCLCVDFVRVTNCFYDYDYEMTDADKLMNPCATFWERSGRHPDPKFQIRINPEIWIRILDHFWLRLDGDAFAEVCTL